MDYSQNGIVQWIAFAGLLVCLVGCQSDFADGVTELSAEANSDSEIVEDTPVAESSTELCNRLAEHPYDPDKVSSGVFLFDEAVESAAIESCESAIAESGSTPKMLYQLGRLLIFTPRSAEGYELIRQSADQGYSFAACTLASAYQTGHGEGKVASFLNHYVQSNFTADHDEAYRWAQIGYKQKEPTCALVLGTAFAAKLGVEKRSFAKASMYYQEAASAGHPIGALELGDYLERRYGTPKYVGRAWKKEAYRLRKKQVSVRISRIPSAEGCIELTEHWEDPNATGPGVTDDALRSVEAAALCERFLRESPENPGALYGAARANFHVIRRATPQMIDRLVSAAESGHVPAKLLLARIFGYSGEYGNVVRANQLIRSASEAGLPQATAYLGRFHLDGIGVDKSPKKAIQILEDAAAKGSGMAYADLARIFIQGLGVPSNPERGLEFARQSFEIDPHNEQISFAIAHLLLSKEPVTQSDIQEAIKFLQYSSFDGLARGSFTLYELYDEGKKIAKDKQLAEYWLNVASSQGHSEAGKLIRERMRQAHDEAEEKRRQQWVAGYQERLITNRLTGNERLALHLQQSVYDACSMLGWRLWDALGTSRESMVAGVVDDKLSRSSYRMCSQ